VRTFQTFATIPGLRHAITTRTDPGVSQGPYAAANLAYHVGDDRDHVTRNRELLARSLGYHPARLTAAQQVHGTNMKIVTKETAGRGALSGADAIPACDALLTREPDLPLLIMVADCAPILMVDPETRALAVVHAGWRGALGGIAGAAVRRMQSEWDTRPENVRVGIGPCLCLECLEVGPEVAAQLNEADRDCARPGARNPHLDLRRVLGRDLERAGVRRENVEVLEECPRCDGEIWFSHRGHGGATGRFGVVGWWARENTWTPDRV